jgi:hypothetical protein
MATNIFDFAKALPPWLMLGFGIVTGGLRAAWSFLYEHTIGYAITRVSISLTVEDSEHRDAYLWLSCWVEKNLRGRKVSSLLLRTHEHEQDFSSAEFSGFEMIPEYGAYYLMYKRRPMMVTHHKEAQTDANQRRPVRSIRLQIWFSRDRESMFDILGQAKTAYRQSRSKRVEYFRSDAYGDWIGSTISPRAVSSLFHPPVLVQDLLDDVRTCLNSKQMYEDLGIPYRRSYPQGCDASRSGASPPCEPRNPGGPRRSEG